MNVKSAGRGREKALRRLLVIDRLDVGPLKLEKARLVCPYVVTQKGQESRTELIYRYEEDVFDPDDPTSRNLADMVAAQVALNYGLFCSRIVFHGAFDRHDQRFLENYAAHTAREIYVNKFLMPNEFLTESVAGMLPERASTYLQAKISFPSGQEDTEHTDGARPGWGGDSQRYAVLSSGGKDSLLSFALMQEMGKEVRSVFVNESGRHWLTALNAYRHFSKEIEGTHRVWTNSDRVFAWMLRQLPFIRPDFARVRSDEYPIRLWTVAVFLFGALPLMRKHQIGRLLIGDEFDTSIRVTHKGITHYAGLYDQSWYFDNAMSRYFRRKGWGIGQFSILRSLSELLILKILAERYPDLQRTQMSCHAAHTKDDHVFPCGNCEKCRRIVAMMTAFGANPANCGYSQEQIDRCLQAVVEKGVHQEAACGEHVLHLLAEKGMVDSTGGHRPHAEVMQLRFDTRHSPFDAIPQELRRPLYEIFLSHAEGAVQRRDRNWVTIDPLVGEALATPYGFAGPSDPASDGGGFILGELTWPEAQESFRAVDVALLPVGAIEQHGPHLPLDTDAYDAERLACDVARACTTPHPLVLPLIPYGVSYHHDDFAGTLSIGPDTLSRLVYEIGMAAVRNGVKKLIIVNGHGGNGPALHFAAQMINRDGRIFTCVDTGETSDTDIESMTETPNDVHAGEVETSTSLALRPHLVKMDRAETHILRFSSEYLDFTSKRGVGWYARTAPMSPSGVMGDPAKASREKGERMWAAIVRNLVELVEDIKHLTLDEIHQRRY